MRRLARWTTAIAFTLAVIVGVLAVVDNRNHVALHFLGWATPELSIYWWLVSAFALGVLVGWVSAGVRVVRAVAGNRRLRRDLDRSRTELDRAKGNTIGV
ncbi:MAG TPA: LapA family protein [Pseudomonadales bacterium]|nr:LapA family protein [Pseudomonadales bacterium]